MTRFRLYLDKDKEVEWLNRMSDEGYAMDSFFCGFYSFIPCEKGEWQYQIDIGHGFFFTNPAYKEFMKEMGVDIVQNWGPWVVLRRKAREGEFALYSDVDSQIAQYKKILLMFKIVTLIEFLILIAELYGACKGVTAAWGFALLIAAIIVAFLNMVKNIKRIIWELRERKGEAVPEYKARPYSPLIPAGFLIDSLTLIFLDSIPGPLKPVLLFLSLVLIIAGAFLSVRNKEKKF
ncbi:MAG: DUF2812 domain-containing protein [Lachnospiraceae bacterium]|nr:DUF2812 domain-containing protein [Lachnospiraceae bacterium]